MTSEGSTVMTIDRKSFYFLAYVLSLITGIVMLVIAGQDRRLKKHAIQSIMLGLLSIIISLVLFFVPFLPTIVSLLIWLYGLYVGFEAYSGKDIVIPWISGFADEHSR